MATRALFCVGDTLAGMVNLETLIEFPPHVFEGGAIPLIAPVRARLNSSDARNDGQIDAGARFDALSLASFRTLIYTLFGDWVTGSAEKYVVWRDEAHYMSPFLVKFVRPHPTTPDLDGDYTLLSGGDVEDLLIPMWNCRLQSVIKSANATLTASERLVYADTSGGNVTLTLPAASAVQANTPIMAEKTSGANTLTVTDGSSPVAVTAIHSRLTFVSDGSTWSRWMF